MNNMSKSKLREAVKNYLDKNGIGQAELARRAGVSQAVVSRCYNGKWNKYAKSIKQLSEFLDIKHQHPDPRKSIKLMSALSELWDGSPEGEDALASFLESVKALEFYNRSLNQFESNSHQDK